MTVAMIFNAGMDGFARAQQDATQASANINRATTAQLDTQQLQLGRQPQGASNGETLIAPVAETPRLEQELVNLQVAELQAKASARVISSADELLGTIIDIRA
ncbi:hypothetical protein WCN91_06745 [Pseudoalteromonas sp. YIC-827]|uniref:Flagellar basal-body/hook protein C-terminal domain-containing protein n=1 Tax=Pseudoalteromonas qingdaonensis TaxID=3131913 RepID=A0ABU9MWB6_9GAMM